MAAGLFLATDRFTLLSSENGILNTIETRELVQPFEQRTLNSGDIALDGFSDVIRSLAKKAHLSNNETGAVLANDMVILKRVPVPLGLDDSELTEHLDWESNQWCASKINNYKVASERLSYQNEAGNPFYLQVYLRKKMVQTVKKIVKNAGLLLKDVDVDIFSHIRSLVTNFNITEISLTLLICFEKKSIKYIFLKNGEYYISIITPLPVGFTDLYSIPDQDLGDLVVKKIRQILFGHKLGKATGDISQTYVLNGGQTTLIMDALTHAGMQNINAMSPMRTIRIDDSLKAKDEPLSHALHVSASLGETIKLDPALKKAAS